MQGLQRAGLPPCAPAFLLHKRAWQQHVQLQAHGKGCISHPAPDRSNFLLLAVPQTRAGGVGDRVIAGVGPSLRTVALPTVALCHNCLHAQVCGSKGVTGGQLGARPKFAAGCALSLSQTCQCRRHVLGSDLKELPWRNLVLGRGFAATRADMRRDVTSCAFLFFLACDQPAVDQWGA